MKDIPLLDPVTELKKLFDAKKFDAAIESVSYTHLTLPTKA